MKLKNIGYAALLTVATAAFVLGTAGSSEAAKKKKATAAPQKSAICSMVYAPVCATRGNSKFTYANACFAGNDGASVASNKACSVKATKKTGKKKGKKAKKAKRAKKAMKT
jgi:hypothetical protein